ncbi:hypothetical protein F0U62_36775 [Cystobacter fuscus]|nr:hypothetical protein F0U62_36775 [Cystobacter fuscus]
MRALTTPARRGLRGAVLGLHVERAAASPELALGHLRGGAGGGGGVLAGRRLAGGAAGEN